jgi:hypothetical protein
MLVAVALALTSVLHPIQLHRPQVSQHRYKAGGWLLTVGHDRFTDALTCSLKTRTMHYRNETVIFHLKNGLETTHAFYRVDDGPAAPVSGAFHAVEMHGFFPRRGWVDDPAGGDVVLPVSYLRDADRVWIRASTKMAPTAFKVNRLDEALDRARAEGCTEASFKSAS